MELPDLDRASFARRLDRCVPEPLPEPVLAALWGHYRLLREWSRRLSLVGPGTAAEVVERHYGESLAVLPWIPVRGPAASLRLLDVGSGAGFPGFVLAAARPRLEVWLAESRQRKWAFLRAAAARAALPVSCLDARVSARLPPEIPEEIDLLTLRAVKLPPAALAALLERLPRAGALYWWRGAGPVELPAGWVPAREIPLAGSRRRRVVEVRRAW